MPVPKLPPTGHSPTSPGKAVHRMKAYFQHSKKKNQGVTASMGQFVGGYGGYGKCGVAGAGYGGGYGGSLWTSTGVILVLFILLVIVSRAFVI